MTVEADIRTALAAHAALTALVGTRIALSAVPQGSELPLVVYSVQHEPSYGLDNTVLGEECSVSIECWAETGAAARAVADAAIAALAASTDAAVVSQSSAFDADLGIDGVVVVAQWWAS